MTRKKESKAARVRRLLDRLADLLRNSNRRNAFKALVHAVKSEEIEKARVN
ncbi:MAG: hypothetical protein WA705_12390 [Candidatus Ozemobacteraceae bacterium]